MISKRIIAHPKTKQGFFYLSLNCDYFCQIRLSESLTKNIVHKNKSRTIPGAAFVHRIEDLIDISQAKEDTRRNQEGHPGEAQDFRQLL